jgi:hypothetical protein
MDALKIVVFFQVCVGDGSQLKVIRHEMEVSRNGSVRDRHGIYSLDGETVVCENSALNATCSMGTLEKISYVNDTVSPEEVQFWTKDENLANKVAEAMNVGIHIGTVRAIRRVQNALSEGIQKLLAKE